MILKSKYIFESKTTKLYRNIQSVGVVLLFIFMAYTFASTILLLDARNETKNAKSVFIQTPPDLIVVFTGGPGRIEYAVKKAQEFKQPNVFISGVNEKNSVQTLINPIDRSTNKDHFEIDYTAKNTVENVISTLKYVRANRGLNKILIISSDYHIMRIKQIVATLKKSDDRFEFFYSAVPSSYFHFHNIKLLYVETFKLIRTKVFLQLWNQQTSPEMYY
jgi:uncharacterized SAM-binding protein YcdF (DUF218 family)